jgi:3-hydroxyisobutyrate dehydrogenase
VSTANSVAVLGTGTMGLGMARNLAGAGIEVRAWNRTPERAAPLRDDGVEVHDEPGDAVDGADVVITMLTDADAVAEVAEQALDRTGEDTIWLQCSTVGVAGTDRLAELAGKHDVTFVDAPVLGSKQPAEDGELLVLAAGPDDAVEFVRNVFDAVGRETIKLGAAGEATRMKLVLNHWVLSLVESLAETISFAEGVGIEPSSFLEAIDEGPLNSPYAQAKGKAILDRELEPSFRLALAHKDAGLVIDAAEASGFAAPLIKVVAEQMQRAIDDGHGDEDMAATWYATSVRAAEPSEEDVKG